MFLNDKVKEKESPEINLEFLLLAAVRLRHVSCSYGAPQEDKLSFNSHSGAFVLFSPLDLIRSPKAHLLPIFSRASTSAS